MLILDEKTHLEGSFDQFLDAFVYCFGLLCLVLKLGLLSYSGSHACAFDETIFYQNRVTFQLGDFYTLRRKKLRCLNEFINGPVWIFQKKDIQDNNYYLSTSMNQFADLWGP